MSEQQAPAGWYPDPEDPGQRRYWDGTAWTAHRMPGTPPVSGPAAGAVTGAPGGAVATHPQATPSLVLGISSLLCCGLVTGIPAMILGRKASKEIQASGGTLQGGGAATAGFWCGLAGTVLTTLALLAFLAIFAFGVALTDFWQEACEDAARDDPSIDLADCRI